ncbi:hypothetical protein TNCT_49011 [Trichonephila clavata]|uniref:Uncharacterized protein n=1 Tax=Trichonephila clavata TaxID=2740835 RepID=A0A8X6FGK8_TRICU|nr:hypothetical protein TNCT_49011 [Trichonephila clavata]
MYFSRLFLEKIVDHAIIGCDHLIFLMERFKDLGEHDLENVYYYWMENVHKKWLPLLDGPALSMRQPDDIETREPDDPYTKHTIRCRAVNFHNWVVSTPMSRLLFTHLLNEVTVHDFEDYINLHERKPHVWFKFYYMKEDDVTFHVCTYCCESSLGDFEICEVHEKPTKEKTLKYYSTLQTTVTPV